MFSDHHVKVFLKEEMFIKDTNKHKYVILYASSFYRIINYNLRNFDELSEHKYTCQFYLKFLKYFYKYGVYKDDIKKKTRKLYRGYTNTWIFSKQFQDNAFISTSISKDIATKFASNGEGNVITFRVSELPENIPFVLIDNQIAPYLDEEEIVFLPGTIDIENGKARWTPNINLEEKCKQMAKGGGGPKFDIPDLELRGKIVVFWRCIQGREPDILGQYRLSKSVRGVHRDFKEQIYNRWDHFDGVKNFIPEYMDFKKAQNKSESEKRKWMSYFVYMAIYDPVSKKVDTLTYGMPSDMYGPIEKTSKIIALIENQDIIYV